MLLKFSLLSLLDIWIFTNFGAVKLQRIGNCEYASMTIMRQVMKDEKDVKRNAANIVARSADSLRHHGERSEIQGETLARTSHRILE